MPIFVIKKLSKTTTNMESNFFKTQSQFLFYEKWKNANDTEESVAVVLTINYSNKTFSIIPQKSSNDKFGFIGGGEQSSLMWFAITEAICKANAFARQELGFIQE